MGTIKNILEALSGILGSKKALMAIISAIVWLVGKVGYDLDTEALGGAVAPLWAYIFGQSLADHKKEAVKEQAKRGHEDFEDDSDEDSDEE